MLRPSKPRWLKSQPPEQAQISLHRREVYGPYMKLIEVFYWLRQEKRRKPRCRKAYCSLQRVRKTFNTEMNKFMLRIISETGEQHIFENVRISGIVRAL